MAKHYYAIDNNLFSMQDYQSKHVRNLIELETAEAITSAIEIILTKGKHEGSVNIILSK